MEATLSGESPLRPNRLLHPAPAALASNERCRASGAVANLDVSRMTDSLCSRTGLIVTSLNPVPFARAIVTA